MKQKKQALAKSLLALLCCLAMLIGTTFAWFTDSVTSGINTIAAGNLDVELYHSNAVIDDEKVTPNTKLFLDMNGNSILWEPGVVSYENLRVTNEGDLALIYQLAINTANENYILDNGVQYGLSQVLKVGVVAGGITATDRNGVVNSVSANDWTTLSAFLRSGSLQANGEETWGVVIYWQPGDNDNNWNANNGKQLSSGDALSIDLGIKLTATQEQLELDGFGSDYDAAAKDDVFPSFEGGTAGVPVTPDANGNTSEAVTITAGDITAYVPAGVKLGAGVNSLSLTVREMAFSGSNIELGEGEDFRALDVHVEGVAEDNTTPITITLPAVAPVALNMSNYKVYHVEGTATNEMTLVASDAAFTAHNQFKYDPATGDVVLYMQSFSEVLFVAEDAKWEGGYDYSWYDASKTQLYIATADQLAGFSAIVGGMNGQTQDDFAGKTVTLVANIDLHDTTDENNYVFYPIGYYNSTGSYTKQPDGSVTSTVSSFEGIFDGNGYTVMNFYQNTWEMFGDYNDGYSGTPNHYKDAMGLFGYVYNGTVKNLTVKNFSSDGEFTPTGVIAAFAAGNATFENIAIVDCNPRVYNTGNGGIIGIAGNYESPDATITLKNITVDNTNKITALWGSWDVACGGLVGMFRGNTDGGQAKIHFDNCRVSAQIDVNNDVCANYQYYAYRYAGMMIGSVRHNTTDANGREIPVMDGISANNCTVNYGNWNNYYYCELVANSLASYTHDYQFSRLTQVQKIEGNTVYHMDGTTSTIPSSGRANYVIVNGSHSTENATCYHYVDGQLWDHDSAGKETVNDEEIWVEDHRHIYLPFEDQIVTGYGWGVDSRGISELPGIVDVELGSYESSVEKWTGKNVGTLMTHKTIKLGDLFAANGASIPVLNESVTVAVVDKDNAAPISAKITRNNSDWTKTTLVLEGYGTAQIVIQDYYFCKPTVITVNVANPLPSLVPDDLVTNGNFEDNTTGWSKNSSSTISASAAYTGLYGINLKGNGSYDGMLNQTMTVEPGQTYTLFFWIRANNSGVNIQIKDQNNNGEALVKGGYFSSTSWTKKQYTFTATSDKVYLNFCGAGNGIAEDIYVDSIILEKKKIVTNGHIEYGYDGSWITSSAVSIVHDDTHSGNYAFMISNPSAWSEALVQRPIAVKPNTEYKVSFWTKRVENSGADGNGVFNVIISQGTYPWTNFTRIGGQTTYFNYATNKGWVKHSITVDSGNFSDMMLKFTAEKPNAGAILIDDITVIELKESSFDGYLYNGDMEAGDTNYWDIYQHTEVTAGAAYTGNFGLQLVGDGGWGGMANQDIKNLTVGQKYKVTLWVKVVKYGTNIGFSNITKDKENSSPDTWLKESTYSEWTQLTYVFTANASTVNMNFSGGGDKPEGGALIYVDDVVVTPYTP